MANNLDKTSHEKISSNKTPKPFLIGVAGGTASGKSTVCQRIMEELGQNQVEQRKRQVVTLGMDSFYVSLDDDETQRARRGQYNYDHPRALDFELIRHTLQEIKNGNEVHVPDYDYKHHSRKTDSVKTIYPADVVLVEGILTFYFKELRDLFDMKLFVDTDSDTRLSRRVMRDVTELHRDIEQVLYQYTSFVKPAFEDFCLPTKKYADVIIPRGADNTVAIELIVQHIQDILKPDKRRRPTVKRQRTSSESLMFVTQLSNEPADPSSPTSDKYTSAH